MAVSLISLSFVDSEVGSVTVSMIARFVILSAMVSTLRFSFSLQSNMIKFGHALPFPIVLQCLLLFVWVKFVY